MARETQREKIERLEKQLNSANEIIKKQNEDILKMQDEADNSFNNSPDYMQMKKRIEDLELLVKCNEDSIEHNRKLYESELKTNEKLFLENQELHKLINENEIEELKNKLKGHQEEIKKLTDRKDKIIQDEKNSSEQWHDLYIITKEKNEELINKIQKLECKETKKIHNERGAGRKAKFTDEEIAMIQMYRFQGKKLQEIADMFNCSVGLIHKLINKK